MRIDGGTHFAAEDIAQMDALAYPHLCDLYRPSRLSPIPGSTDNPSGLQVGDTGYDLATQNVRCCFGAAPESNQPNVMGRVGADNIYTLDQFAVPGGVEIHDAWALVFLSAGDNYREVYILQGEPQSSNPHPWGAPSVQIAFAKRVSSTVHPAGIVIRNPLGVA